MTTFSELVDDVALVLEGYGISQGRAAFLSVPIDEDDTNGILVDEAGINNLEQGVAEIGDELVYIQSIDTNSNTITMAPDGRGYRSTVATAHLINTRITMNPVFPRALIKRKVNETITGLWPTLQAEAATEFSASPVVYGYEMPADTEDIVSVFYDVRGASQATIRARHWKPNRHADPDVFPSGFSLMLWDQIDPGSTIRVTYRKRPSELVDLTDDLTDSGLEDSARSVITWGAAWRLVSFMDPSRLAVVTAQADLVDEANPLGRAMDISRVLRAGYEQELSDEQRRQQLRTPPSIHYQEY